MTLTYKLSKGGEPAPDAFGLELLFSMSMVGTRIPA